MASLSNAQAPTISTFSPTTGPSGTSVIIAGSNFTGTTSVSFGSVPAASFTVIGSTAISAVVGSGATGSVSVTTPAGTGSLAGFIFTAPPPTITSFSPVSGPIGSTVTIFGTNFSAIPANNIVSFGAVRAKVTVATNSYITAVVPDGATFQPITVTVNGYIASSFKPFIITFSGASSQFTANTFSSKIDFTVMNDPNSVAISDMDGDGKPDILSLSPSLGNGLCILRNTSTGAGNLSFAPKVNYKINVNQNNHLYVSDLDGDGMPDVLFLNNLNSRFAVLRNTTTAAGTVTLSSEMDYSTNAYPRSINVGDIDGDGKPDILVTCYNTSAVSVFLNTSTIGNISFGPKIDVLIPESGSPPYTGAFYSAIGDMDGDGKLDIVVSNAGVNGITVMRNLSTGTGSVSFAIGTSISAGYNPGGIALGDLNNGGKLDIVVTDVNGQYVSMFTNNSTPGNFSFSSDINISTLATAIPTTVFMTDFDGDSKIDLAVVDQSTRNVSLFKNTGSTVFNYSLVADNLNTTTEPSYLAIGDLDGDGKPDIVVCNDSSSTLSIYRNQVGVPTITTFSPDSATGGTTIIITGTNFLQATAVSFGGVAASSFTVINATTIVATLGAGTSGAVSVTTPAGTASLAGFIYLNGTPAISSFSPVHATSGTTVTITGINFTAATAISFGGIAADSFKVINNTTITAKVGKGASGSISVTTPGGTASVSGFIYCTPAITSKKTIVGCNSLLYEGIIYTGSATITDTTRSVQGCDSIYTKVTISIDTAKLNFISLSGCNVVYYKNIAYTNGTVVKDTIKNTQGCDSIINIAIIDVNVLIPVKKDTSYNSCNSIVYNGITYNTSTSFTDTIRSIRGCDSIYITVNINIVNIGISGGILHPSKGYIIPDVSVIVNGTNNYNTTNTGSYGFNCLPNSSNETIRLYKINDINKTNGVSTIDVALIQSHILGKNILNSPYKLIAADVNGDGKVSILDIVYIKRLVLGIDTIFTNSVTGQKRLWTFVDSSYKYPDTTNPFPIKDSISFIGLNAKQTNQTFIGIKLGDVNWDWNPAIARMPSPVFVRPRKLSVSQ